MPYIIDTQSLDTHSFDSDDWGVSALDRRTYIWDMADNMVCDWQKV